MGAYTIGIGGTGARCLESLVHLCAAGLGPDKLFVLIIDPDNANGNVGRLRDVIAKYNNCRKKLNCTQSSPIFKTEIEYSREEHTDYLSWSPIEDEKNLRKYFNYDTLISKDPESKEKLLGDFATLLYSEGELNLDLSQGFRARCSVGAPVMARIKDNFNDNPQRPWSELITRIRTDLTNADARLFVFASLFGGTGASGFPTVAKILRDESLHTGKRAWQNPEKFFLGGAPLLPYFAFEVQQTTDRNDIFATPQNFVVNTKAALQHYSLIWRDSSPYDVIYYIGDQEFESIGKFSPGGKNQINYAHYVEFLSALSALDFFTRNLNPEITKKEMLQYFAGRTKEKTIYWDDFPKKELKKKLLAFTSFAFSFRCFYYQLLRDEDIDLRRFLVPWYADHFKSDELTSNEAKEPQDNLSEYLKTYLEWLFQIHSCKAREIRLLNPAAFEASREADFQELDDELFKTLQFKKDDDDKCKYESKYKYGYDNLWEKLCSAKPSSIIKSSSGRFADLLYAACYKFCLKNYNIKDEKERL